MDKQIKQKCKEEKEKWYNDQCKEIEDFERQHRMRELHEQVKKLTNKKRGIKTNSRAIKDKNGILLFDKQEVANRWEEYIKELYDDKARPAQKELYETKGPDLMKEEINHAINSIKSGKAGGKDRILIEHLKALDDEALGIVHNLCQDIHATGHIPDDLRHSLFIKLPKKAKAMDCSQHHMISLMSHLMKVILKVILTRNERVLDSEIGETQAGFRSGLGTREGIFNLRAIFDAYLDVRKDVFICFIDYEKAFDHVYHHNLMNELNKYTIDGKDLNIMQNLYWNQTASIQLEDEESNQFSIKRGVRQGCILSPKLFNIYTEDIFNNSNLLGIKIAGKNITNLRYADDTALMAESEEALQRIVDEVKMKSLEKGLKMNTKKTKTMVISRNTSAPQVSIKVDGETLEQVQSFKYLGQTITTDGKTDTKIGQ